MKAFAIHKPGSCGGHHRSRIQQCADGHPAVRRIDSAATLRAVIGERIVIDIDVPDRAITALCDSVQLQQVVTNLVTNARDAMPGGGRITLMIADRRNLAGSFSSEVVLERIETKEIARY